MQRRAGFTLIETLIVAAIITIVFGVTCGAMRIYSISISLANKKSRISAEANIGLNKLIEGLSLSNQERLAALNPATLETTGVSEIIFSVPAALDTSQSIQWGDDGGNVGYKIKYYLGNLTKSNQLIKDILDGSNAVVSSTVIGNDITALNFILSGNSLAIDITAGKAQKGQEHSISLDLSGSVNLRN